MGKVSQVTVSVTKQIRPYEPVRIEMTVDREGDADTPQSLASQAFDEITDAFSEAIARRFA